MSNIETLYEKLRMNFYKNRALSMMNIFKVDENELFSTWLNKFEYVADLIEIPDNKMVKFFEKMMDKNITMYVKETINSVNPSQLSYDEIINHYLRHFTPCYVSNLHRSRFLHRNQYENESIEKYGIHLKKIYQKCCDTYYPYSEKELCKQFIHGICDYELRNYLSKNLSYSSSFVEILAKAVEHAKIIDITYYLTEVSLKICTYKAEQKCLFYKWLNKFEYIVDIIEVPDMKLVRLFRKMVNINVHTSVEEAFPLVNFYELSYEEMVNYYLRYFAPSYETDLHRIRFLCRKQYDKEPINKYANNLRQIYNKCDHKMNSEEELSGKFINGLRNDQLRIYFNETSNLSFDEIVKKAIEFSTENDLSEYLIPARRMIRVYNPDTEVVFYYWLNKFEFVADFVGVPNTKMVEFFVQMIKSDIHESVQENYASVKFSELSYEEMVDYYLRYFAPCYENDFYRCRFMCRMQYENETIEKYAYSLRKIHDKCDYIIGFEQELCEQFINGIYNDIVRTYLSNMPKLSYNETIAFAMSFEKELLSLING